MCDDIKQLLAKGLSLGEMQSVKPEATSGIPVVGLHVWARSLGHLATVSFDVNSKSPPGSELLKTMITLRHALIGVRADGMAVHSVNPITMDIRAVSAHVRNGVRPKLTARALKNRPGYVGCNLQGQSLRAVTHQ